MLGGGGGRVREVGYIIRSVECVTTETDILHIIAPNLRCCISSLSKHTSQEVQCGSLSW